MPKKKQVELSVIKYRKIVLDRGVRGRPVKNNGIWRRRNPSEWDVIYKTVSVEEQNAWFIFLRNELEVGGERHRARERFLQEQNHPLVEKGIAFWLNDKTIVTGYTLKNNPKIYRPIFQVDKESLKFKLRDEIRKYSKFFVAHKRQMLYKKTLMNISQLKILPESIINMIAHWTYDPILYLKL